MKKLALCIVVLAGLAACEPSGGSMQDLNDIPADLDNIAPEV